MPRFLEIRLIGNAKDIEEFVGALRAANILSSDSINYPDRDSGKVRRYVDVVMPGTKSSTSLTLITLQSTDGK